MPAPLIAAAAPMLGRLGLAAVQTVMGLGKPPERPEAQVPDAVKAATENARAQANTTVRPGRDQAEEAIKGNTADAISRIKSIAKNPALALNAVSASQTQENRAMLDQDVLDAQYKDHARRDLTHQLNQQGQWEDRAAEWNERQKFAEESQTRASLLSAGLSNIDTVGQDFGSLMMMKSLNMLPGAAGTKKTKSPAAGVNGPAVYANAQKGMAVNPFFHKFMLGNMPKL